MVSVAIRRPAVDDGIQAPDVILGMWQELNHHVLSPPRAEEFRNHRDLPALCRYDPERLRKTGADLYQRSGRLRLAEWVRECTWDGGGSAALAWHPLAEGDPDAEIAARDLLAAAVASIWRERDRTLLTQRLGLDGHGTMTVTEISQQVHLTHERLAQSEDRAIDQLSRRHTPPSASDYVGAMIAALIGEARQDDAEPAVVLLRLAEAACPGVPAAFAVQVLARLAGHSKHASRHLAAEGKTLLMARQAQLARETRSARAAERLSRLLAHAEWPGGRALAPHRQAIRPQRETEGYGAGTWLSAKLNREVRYDSVAELSLIRVLDRAPQVLWFCEQPAAIGDSYAGRHRTYYPDLLAATSDGYCVLIEVKPLNDMPLAVNQAKAAAARAFCARGGWGYLLTDADDRTLHDLLNAKVPEHAARAFTAALDAKGTMTWPDIKAQRERHQLTPVQLSALALRSDWHITLNPYRMARSPLP